MNYVPSISIGLLGFFLTHLLSAGVTTFLAVRMYRYYRNDSLGRSFGSLVAVITIWILGAVLEMAARLSLDPNTYAAGAAFKFIGVMATPVAFFVFALRYDGRDAWVNRRVLAGLSVVPALTIPFALTTVRHGLFYDEILQTSLAGQPLLYATLGPGWWVVVSYSYVLLIASSVLFAHASMTRWPYYRFEIGFVLGGIGVTWATNLAYVLAEWPHPTIDPTPIGLTLTSILLVVGIFSTRMMDVPLPGRFQVFEAIDDAIVVLDDKNRVVDANDAAKTILGVRENSGEPAAKLLPWTPTGADKQDESNVEELLVNGERRLFKQRVLSVDEEAAGWTVLVLTDITDELGTERLRAQRDVFEAQRDDLDTLNRVVRHDIRNDLQVVSAYGEMLEDRLTGENQTYAETIRESAMDAIEFTKAARDLSETMLSAEPELEPISLRETLRSEQDLAQSKYDESVVAIDGEIPAVDVEADEMLSSLFRNLIENAIQHNDKPIPEVHITATVSGDRVQVRVADNGPGVPADRVKHIFEKGEMGLESGGTGLGLYLVEAFVERYEGDVWVEDNEPTGAVFCVELPKCE